MKRSIIALILVVFLILPTMIGCKKPNTAGSNNSSTIASEEQANDSSVAQSDNESKKESSKVSTTSTVKDNQEDDEETSSTTQSQSVKVNRDGLKIGIYHMSMYWCDSYGTDFESREREFRENVEAGYFNTYFLNVNDLGKGYLLKEIEIIAKHGYTFWLAMDKFNSDSEIYTLEQSLQFHSDQLEMVINAITKMGYRDNLMGMIWDEPIWNGQTNKDFLAESEMFYKKFGLRTFPVFATGEFSGIEGNLNTPSEKMGKVAKEALKYVTDVAFDSYGVDVRLDDKYVNGSQANRYSAWAQELGVEVKNGRDYYIGYKELLKKRVGHDVNIWYFPTAYNWPISNGGEADEEFCIAHLKFMAEDLMKEKHQGGIALYTYYAHQSERISFAQRCDITDKKGKYTRYPEHKKWVNYCKVLRETKAKFDSVKAKVIDIKL